MLHDRRSFFSTRCAVVAGIVLATSVAGAQAPARDHHRWEAGVEFDFAHPVGDFGQNENNGVGGTGHLVLALDSASSFGIRADGGYFNFGSESKNLTTDYRHEDTSNDIVVFTVGPQITLPHHRIQPYINGGVGAAFFYTQKGFGVHGGQGVPQTTIDYTSYVNTTVFYTGGTGIKIPTGIAGRPFAIDLGAKYNSVIDAKYLSKNHLHVVTSNDDSILLPHEATANFLSYHIGLSAGF